MAVVAHGPLVLIVLLGDIVGPTCGLRLDLPKERRKRPLSELFLRRQRKAICGFTLSRSCMLKATALNFSSEACEIADPHLFVPIDDWCRDPRTRRCL